MAAEGFELISCRESCPFSFFNFFQGREGSLDEKFQKKNLGFFSVMIWVMEWGLKWDFTDYTYLV